MGVIDAAILTVKKSIVVLLCTVLPGNMGLILKPQWKISSIVHAALLSVLLTRILQNSTAYYDTYVSVPVIIVHH